MLFVLSAAVKFHAKPAVECAVRSTPRLKQKAQALAAELRRLEAKDIKKQLHVNDALARQYAASLADFDKQREVLPCCCLYDSPLFSSMGADCFDVEEAQWANDHIRIFSGLYGLLRPFDEITPLSLPVSLGTKLKNSQGNFLKDYWNKPVHQELSQGLKHLPMPVMINMAAQQDSEIIDMASLPDYTSVTSVDFKTRGKDDNAENKGEFLRWAMEQRCMTVDELLEYRGLVDEDEAALYRISTKDSSGDAIVFEDNVGEGGHGGWSKKLAESGKGKRAFIKEFASGKKRHERGDINKALAKDAKTKRKANAQVY